MIKFKDLPVEIQQRMLDEQERQGYQRNPYEFMESVAGGFAWSKSVDGCAFWKKILLNGDFTDFYAKYPKHPTLKVIPLHVKILDSKVLLEEIAERLVTEWRNGGCLSGRVEIDGFEHSGFHWSASAEIEVDYESKQYDYDTPSEVYFREMSVEIESIECTDKEGNPVRVDFYDDESTQIREDDFIEKRVIAMGME